MKDNQFELHLCGDYRYTLFAAGYAEIMGYTGQAKELTIPEILDDHPVISIGEEAFRGCESLTSVVIAEGIQYIGQQAFANCCALTSATLPDSLYSIEDSAFQGCPDALTFVVIQYSKGHEWAKENHKPHILTHQSPYCYGIHTMWPDCAVIEEYNGAGGDVYVPETLDGYPVICVWERAFRGYKSLTSIVLPEGLEYIAEEAFQSCESLTSITLPKRLKTIGRWAFAGCRSLRTVEIPSSVEQIGYHAFHHCANDLIFRVTRGSYAHQWAEEMKYPHIDLDDQH